ncbi:hypothetical protein [Ferrimonas senticii]|uniref:hypothetical protein n=1 Tax=Ferrimonas senticii TaxID=394566 RepID=UPI00041E1764|nr:hypothetical protein [Ferrimonas senticii]
MLQWYPNQIKIGAAPALTLVMVALALLGRLLPPSNLILWPLMATLPLIALVHLWLMVDDEVMDRLDAFFYALVHLPLAFVVWTFSIVFASGSNIF